MLGIWPGTGDGESAKFWFACLTELKNRGVKDVFFVVCDGLKGLPDSIGSVFPAATVQTCLIHLLRNSFGYASKRHWPEIAANLRPVYHSIGLPDDRIRDVPVAKPPRRNYAARGD